MIEPEHVDRASPEGSGWRLDPKGAGFVVWGGGTFGAGPTLEAAKADWREALRSLRATLRR